MLDAVMPYLVDTLLKQLQLCCSLHDTNLQDRRPRLGQTRSVSLVAEQGIRFESRLKMRITWRRMSWTRNRRDTFLFISLVHTTSIWIETSGWVSGEENLKTYKEHKEQFQNIKKTKQFVLAMRELEDPSIRPENKPAKQPKKRVPKPEKKAEPKKRTWNDSRDPTGEDLVFEIQVAALSAADGRTNGFVTQMRRTTL
ncbi:hypothetical protein EDD86DRAFT_221133 [Gorgonomyces haynaldii]|nr:hypothetical protein EDD86DRAFT_221133 [Gorgonomyces haynaldii]